MNYWLLLLSLQEMDKRNFNGPDFKYRVFWRRVVGSGPNWHTNYTTTSPFTVNDIGNFSAFEIKVQAVNGKGDGPEPDPGIGYSGENGKIYVYFFKRLLNSFSTGFVLLGIFLLGINSHLSPSCLSLSLSSIGGSNECRC